MISNTPKMCNKRQQISKIFHLKLGSYICELQKYCTKLSAGPSKQTVCESEDATWVGLRQTAKPMRNERLPSTFVILERQPDLNKLSLNAQCQYIQLLSLKTQKVSIQSTRHGNHRTALHCVCTTCKVSMIHTSANQHKIFPVTECHRWRATYVLWRRIWVVIPVLRHTSSRMQHMTRYKRQLSWQTMIYSSFAPVDRDWSCRLYNNPELISPTCLLKHLIKSPIRQNADF